MADTDSRALRRCFRDNWHPAHTWRYGGKTVWCDGFTSRHRQPEVQGRCCADPLCGCDFKPGWGPYSEPADYPDGNAIRRNR